MLPACCRRIPPTTRAFAARLEDRFDLLRGRSRGGPARHQTLTAALAWSDDLLTVPERTLLRRLSVFEGPFNLQAAEEVCAGGVVERPQVFALAEGVAVASVAAQDHTHVAGMTSLAELTRLAGEHTQARKLFEECLVEARATGAPYPFAHALLGLGRVWLDLGVPQAAGPPLDEAASVAGQAGLTHLVAAAHNGLGEVAAALQDSEMARARYDEALALAGRCGDRAAAATATYHLAELAREEDNLARSASLQVDALRQRHRSGEVAGVADSLDALAGLAVDRGDLEVAARLLGATDALRQLGGLRRSPRQRDRYDAAVAVLNAQMSLQALEEAWGQGAAMTLQEAVSYATRGRGPRDRPITGPESLTPAERDVVALVGDGTWEDHQRALHSEL